MGDARGVEPRAERPQELRTYALQVHRSTTEPRGPATPASSRTASLRTPQTKKGLVLVLVFNSSCCEIAMWSVIDRFLLDSTAILKALGLAFSVAASKPATIDAIRGILSSVANIRRGMSCVPPTPCLGRCRKKSKAQASNGQASHTSTLVAKTTASQETNASQPTIKHTDRQQAGWAIGLLPGATTATAAGWAQSRQRLPRPSRRRRQRPNLSRAAARQRGRRQWRGPAPSMKKAGRPSRRGNHSTRCSGSPRARCPRRT